MKKMISATTALLLAGAIGGCSTTGTDGVVEIAPNHYMIGGLGRFTDFSGSAVLARLFQDANRYCASKNMVVVPISSTRKDSEFANYASAEVQFACAPAASR